MAGASAKITTAFAKVGFSGDYGGTYFLTRMLGSDHPDDWGPLMQPVRRAAVKLMKEGRLLITRKGRPVDPDDFRGVYRLSLPSGDQGAGNSSSV